MYMVETTQPLLLVAVTQTIKLITRITTETRVLIQIKVWCFRRPGETAWQREKNMSSVTDVLPRFDAELRLFGAEKEVEVSTQTFGHTPNEGMIIDGLE